MADQGSGQQQQGNVEDASRSRTNEQAGTRGQETAAPSAANGPAPSGQRVSPCVGRSCCQCLLVCSACVAEARYRNRRTSEELYRPDPAAVPAEDYDGRRGAGAGVD